MVRTNTPLPNPPQGGRENRGVVPSPLEGEGRVGGDAASYVNAFRAFARASEPRWLSEKREAAIRRFSELGFPTRRQEAWRFTDLRPLQRAVFPPATTGAAPRLDDAHRLSDATHRIVLVNGRFAPELSDLGELPKGAWLASTARTLAERPA